MSFPAHLFPLAWRGLRARPVRSGLTALSVTVAATGLTVFLALGAGLREAVEAQIGSIGPQLQVSRAPALQSLAPPPNLPVGVLRQVEAQRGPLRLQQVTPVVLGSRGEGGARVTLYGVPAAGGLNRIYPRVRVDRGRLLRAADEGRAVAVLGARVAQREQLDVGDTLLLTGDVQVRVVGTLAETGTLTDGFVVTPIGTLQRALRVPGLLSLVAVEVADEQVVPEVAAGLSKTVDAEVQTQAEFRQVARRLLTISEGVQRALGGVALVVGLLCVMTTVSMSALERRAEFATLRALGLRPGQVTALITLESVLLTLAGGTLGLLLGGGLTLGVNVLTRRALGVQATLVTAEVAAQVALVSLLIGLLAGLPAGWRAGRQPLRRGWQQG